MRQRGRCATGTQRTSPLTGRLSSDLGTKITGNNSITSPGENDRLWLAHSLRTLSDRMNRFDNDQSTKVVFQRQLFSVTYKVLTTTQPSHLHHLITIQPPRSARSSSVVTLPRPPTSSLRVTDRSFQYASPRPRNQLPASLR